jgi:hypothetical protein
LTSLWECIIPHVTICCQSTKGNLIQILHEARPITQYLVVVARSCSKATNLVKTNLGACYVAFWHDWLEQFHGQRDEVWYILTMKSRRVCEIDSKCYIFTCRSFCEHVDSLGFLTTLNMNRITFPSSSKSEFNCLICPQEGPYRYCLCVSSQSSPTDSFIHVNFLDRVPSCFPFEFPPIIHFKHHWFGVAQKYFIQMVRICSTAKEKCTPQFSMCGLCSSCSLSDALSLFVVCLLASSLLLCVVACAVCMAWKILACEVNWRTGEVALEILRQEWKPVLSINTVIFGLQLLLLEPNFERFGAHFCVECWDVFWECFCKMPCGNVMSKCSSCFCCFGAGDGRGGEGTAPCVLQEWCAQWCSFTVILSWI